MGMIIEVPPRQAPGVEPSEEVAQLPSIEKPSIELVVDNKSGACRHTRTVVNGKERTVTCAACGAIRDPFDVLLILADEHARVETWAVERKRELDRLGREIEILKTAKQNAKQALRRLGVPTMDSWSLHEIARATQLPEQSIERAQGFATHLRQRKTKLRRLK